MKSNVSGISALVLVLVAFSSLVSMIALTRIDNTRVQLWMGYALLDHDNDRFCNGLV
jgi:hypothetical protein